MAKYAAAEDFILLRCFDGEEFHVPSALARRSGFVAAGIDTGEHAATGAVPLPAGVTGRVLAAVIAYWTGRDAVAGTGDLGRYDEQYLAGLSHDVRVDIINAAFHLGERGALRALWATGCPMCLSLRSEMASQRKLATDFV